MGLEGLGAFKSVLGKLDSKLNTETSGELERMANDYAEEARSNVPAGATGDLGASIRVVRDRPDKVVVLAGDDETTDYAAHVEYGTSRMGAQPYMRPAASTAESNLESRMSGAAKKAFGV